jgi:arylsulfatase A-like enzyme
MMIAVSRHKERDTKREWLMPTSRVLLWLFRGLLSLLPLAAGARAEAARPNVLIVMTDDQGYGDFSIHGNPVVKTPNLDHLSSQSLRFTDFHAAPMCTPTRGQLLTGLDAVRNGATSVTGGRSFLRPGIRTMPELFAAAGYKTGLFGKWHLGDNYPHRPLDRGFQRAVYHLGWGFTSAPEFANTLFDGRLLDQGQPQRFQGHVTDVWFTSAMHWMKERHEQGEPFFCYLPTNAPHTPHDESPEYTQPYEGRGPAGFFGMIARIDDNMGRLERFLDETGLRENTILVFLTDNGGTAGVRLFNAGLRAGKTTYYDGGHRVPCWIRWPSGRLGAPRDLTTPTQVQDLLPTLLDLCELKPAADTRFDGTSLAAWIRGHAPAPDDRLLVVQYSRARLEEGECAVIWNQWRLVGGKELYDVNEDRAQQHDVAAEHPQVVQKMWNHYQQWWRELESARTAFVTTSLGAEQQPQVVLTSSDWQDVYCDNSNHIRQAAGGPRGGHWNVHVERAGTYRISLRRWPREVETALGAPHGEMSRTLPIHGAVIRVNVQETKLAGRPADQELVARIVLPAGPAALQAWFLDAQGKELSGAFYAYVDRLEASE